ncbi:Uncharacterised protein [Serratia rubidaea]|nr:Uncharacterised protein [Serratia rubidaea]
MKNKPPLSQDELQLFRDSVTGAKKLRQDTIVHRPPKPKIKQTPPQRLLQEQVDASFYFSDEFQPQLDEDGPTRYVRPGASQFELKKLRRGDYVPDLFLDLHGLTQLQAKQELGR